MDKETALFLKTKILDLKTGRSWIVVLHANDARENGIYAGNKVVLKWGKKETEATVDLTTDLVQPGEIGLLKDVIEKYPIKEGEIIEIYLAPSPSSLEAIRKKIKGERLSYSEISSIVSDIVNYHLDDIQIAFFIASAFEEEHFSLEEIYYLTKAIAETGERFYLDKDIVADKHSIGGLPNNRTTPIVVSIIASLGYLIPKTSSRAVTSACGTADVIEAIAPVEFNSQKIKEIVNKTNGCLVWGGALKLAPADDRLLKVSYELGIEPHSKMITSIMAKKVAMGATHLVIDMPIGKGTKISYFSDALKIRKIFLAIAKRFNIKTEVVVEEIKDPIVGWGVGPLLEIRDILKILNQDEDRSLYLEGRALKLAGILLELIGAARKNQGQQLAKKQLISGDAFNKFQEIIKAQGGKENISLKDIKLGKVQKEIKSNKNGFLQEINPLEVNRLVRLLGAPVIKEGGILFKKRVGDSLKEGEPICELYSNSEQRIQLAQQEITNDDLFIIK